MAVEGTQETLFSEQVEKDAQNDTDDDTCGYGKIELEVFFFDGNIAWKPAEPRCFGDHDEDDTHSRNDQAHDNKGFSNTGKRIHSIPWLRVIARKDSRGVLDPCQAARDV
jgi:hypothetical protein